MLMWWGADPLDLPETWRTGIELNALVTNMEKQERVSRRL